MSVADLFSVLDGAVMPAPLVSIALPGVPRGKGRPRFRIAYTKARKAFAHVYTDAETVKYEKALAWQAKAAMKGKPPYEGPLAVRVFAMMPVMPSWPARKRELAYEGRIHPMGRPDLDNCAKSGLDALNGIVWHDDTQVVRLLVVKEFGAEPGLIVETYRL